MQVAMGFVACNQQTNLQAPTMACILQKNYGRIICTKANAHNHNAALHHLVDRKNYNSVIQLHTVSHPSTKAIPRCKRIRIYLANG